MKAGKLPNDILEKIVFKNIRFKRNDVLVRAGIGKDCSVIDFGEFSCVVSSDPITGATQNIGSLSINVSVNDVASNGAEAIGIMMTILAPIGTSEQEIEDIFKDASEQAEKLNIEIIGGHTEITDAVNRVVISNTVIGKMLKEKLPDLDNVKEDDVVLISKHAGLEGAAIIAHEKENYLLDKLDIKLIKEAKSFISQTSVVEEGMVCGNIGVNYMHDITEGGVLGAIWEASKAINKGIIIDKDIPIKKSTSEICRIFNINPLKLISSGCMLIICDKSKAEEIKIKLKSKDIEVNEIGKVIKEGIYIKHDNNLEKINQPESDELYKVI